MLKNSFVSCSDLCLGAKNAVFGRFEPGSGRQVGPAATFSTGSSPLGNCREGLDREHEKRTGSFMAASALP